MAKPRLGVYPTDFDPGHWSPDLISLLAKLTAKFDELSMTLAREDNRYPGITPFERYRDWEVRRYKRRPEIDSTIHELDSVGLRMADAEFSRRISERVVQQRHGSSHEERCYALYRGSLWSSPRKLESQQWESLVARFLEREEAELAAELTGGDESSNKRRGIPPEVRRAVWVRDQGRCVRCGGRERLEFDHIIPFSRGGSDTERNLELLCENCNRAKSNLIT
jgi:hypothetical protein